MLAFKNFVHEDVTRKGEMVDEAKLVVLTPPANSELRKKLQAAVDATTASSDKKAYASLAVLRASIGDPELLQDIVKYVEAAAKEAQLLEADMSFTFAGRAELRFIDAEMHPQSSTQWSPKFIASADGLGWETWTKATTEHCDEKAAGRSVRAVVPIDIDLAMLVSVPTMESFEVRPFVLTTAGEIFLFIGDAGNALQHVAVARKSGRFLIIDLASDSDSLPPVGLVHSDEANADEAAPATATGDVSFNVRDQLFTLDPAALARLGPKCMLNEMLAGVEVADVDVRDLTWPEPLTIDAFATVMAWASSGVSPSELTPRQWAELFKASDVLNVPELASLSLAKAPPPSHVEGDNESQLMAEEQYHNVPLEPSTFIARRSQVGQALPLGGMPHYFQRPAAERSAEPLFNQPGLLQTTLEQALPPEAKICLDQGLCLAGGFIARLAASLAGLCDEPPPPSVGALDAPRPDMDFFLVATNAEAGLLRVRQTLLALARHCEAAQVGMCVVRSPYAITVAMDDCLYDLQIVLCAFDSAEQVLANFDIDSCKIAYDGHRLVAAEVFLRAITSGVNIARPQYDSPNHAKRLHKYATLPGGGFSVAVADYRGTGKTPELLRQWQWEAERAQLQAQMLVAPRRSGQAVAGEAAGAGDAPAEWEVPFDEASLAIARSSTGYREINGSAIHDNSNPDLLVDAPEREPGPEWGALDVAPAYVAAPPAHGRFIRNREGNPGVHYENTDSREVVEVWRGQRRHPDAGGCYAGRAAAGEAPLLQWGDTWRYQEASRIAFQLSSGSMRRNAADDDEEPDTGDPKAAWHVAKDVVFQQLDMHPVRGSWNKKQAAHLATAVAEQPLPFLDFIEDAALAVPLGCRQRLPRCLSVPMHGSDEAAIFNRKMSGPHWQVEGREKQRGAPAHGNGNANLVERERVEGKVEEAGT